MMADFSDTGHPKPHFSFRGEFMLCASIVLIAGALVKLSVPSHSLHIFRKANTRDEIKQCSRIESPAISRAAGTRGSWEYVLSDSRRIRGSVDPDTGSDRRSLLPDHPSVGYRQ